jgi:hypothetical protein
MTATPDTLEAKLRALHDPASCRHCCTTERYDTCGTMRDLRTAAALALEEVDAALTELHRATKAKGLDREAYGVLDARDVIRALAAEVRRGE